MTHRYKHVLAWNVFTEICWYQWSVGNIYSSVTLCHPIGADMGKRHSWALHCPLAQKRSILPYLNKNLGMDSSFFTNRGQWRCTWIIISHHVHWWIVMIDDNTLSMV